MIKDTLVLRVVSNSIFERKLFSRNKAIDHLSSRIMIYKYLYTHSFYKSQFYINTTDIVLKLRKLPLQIYCP